jgi:hypothetical protein
MTRKVYVAMMSRDRPQTETQFCLLEMQRGFDRERIPHRIRYTVGDSMIPKTRNFFVADFLASDCTDLIMLDDDLWWEDGAVQRLLRHDCDLVAGVYPKRQDPLEYPVRRLEGAALDPKTGLLEVKYLPTGFMRITRKCLEQMTAHYSELAYTDFDCPNNIAHALFWFELRPDEDLGTKLSPWGEDFEFCRKWREMGGKVYLDALLKFSHIGRKRFTGCYADDLPASALLQPAA